MESAVVIGRIRMVLAIVVGGVGVVLAIIERMGARRGTRVVLTIVPLALALTGTGFAMGLLPWEVRSERRRRLSNVATYLTRAALTRRGLSVLAHGYAVLHARHVLYQ
jgi:hypothetical protein